MTSILSATNSEKRKSVQILGLTFPVLCYDSALTIFEKWIEGRVSKQVCIANVHTVMTSQSDSDFFKINKQADMLTMDGQPLRWYANVVHGAGIKERVCGPELMLKCLEYGQNRGWKHYFYGGSEDVLKKLVSTMAEKFPKAEIVGWYSPPFRMLDKKEDLDIVRALNESKADFLWVGLGAPKQEAWISSHLDSVHIPVQLGVGAAFDFHSGNIDRAPQWMQNSGLEWVFRLVNDPRLWRRYLSTNPKFIFAMLRDWWQYRVMKRLL